MPDTKKPLQRNYPRKFLSKTCIPSRIEHKRKEMIQEELDKEVQGVYSGCCWDEYKSSEEEGLSDIGVSNLNVEA